MYNRDFSADPAAAKHLLARAGLVDPAALRAFVANGVLPAGATVTPAVFMRAALVLGLGMQLTDTGLG